MKTTNKIVQRLPYGKYIVVDPIYVLSDSDYIDIRVQVFNECASGEVIDHNGDKLIAFETYFGDDVFKDTDGNEYPVDDGLIAAIPLDLCDQGLLKEVIENGFGKVIESSDRILCSNIDGVIVIGEISINTKEGLNI